MLAMREKQIRQLVAPGTINAKLSAGGLVDCEYLVQGLQLRHGGQIPSLRATNTREAIEAMRTARVLSQADYESLRSAHSFLRRLINALRVVRGNARDLTVPTADSVDFAFLARQLGYDAEVDRLQADLSRTLTNARGQLLRLL